MNKVQLSIENLIKSHEAFKRLMHLTDKELLITAQDFQDPNNPYPQSVLLNSYTYIKDPSDFANDLCIYSIDIDPNERATLQIAHFQHWLSYIYSEAYPTIQVIKPLSYNNNTYLVIVSQFC